MVDDDVWFAPVGEDIYIVWSIPELGELACLSLHPDGRLEVADVIPDPLSPELAKLN
jgi:hypothetical protein